MRYTIEELSELSNELTALREERDYIGEPRDYDQMERLDYISARIIELTLLLND